MPLAALHYCLAHTQCKLIILDAERADLLEPVSRKLAVEAGTQGFLVLECHEGKGAWEGMKGWDDVLSAYRGDATKLLQQELEVTPEDNATIIFTSGTTGLPKGVLSTQRMFLTNVLNVLVGSRRAVLRRGEDIPLAQDGPQRGVLVSVPLFHVTGSTALSMLASAHGMKIVMMRKWVPEEAARLIQLENVGVAGGVPSMVADLTESSVAGFPLDGLIFGGSPAPNQLPERAKRAFPGTLLSQSYGLTETNSVAVSIAGEDYASRPGSTGLAAPVNDIMIVKDGTTMPPGHVGEVWIRGPNVMKEYWRDPAATAKAITKDGWFKSGDLGTIDEEGFLYIRDRLKDLIIRGGENIDSVSVENAIYEDSRVAEVAAVGVPDKRLGELVAAVVSIKSAFGRQVSERELIAVARKKFVLSSSPAHVLVSPDIWQSSQIRRSRHDYDPGDSLRYVTQSQNIMTFLTFFLDRAHSFGENSQG
jgi:acyl-CoA synthetase (AMP-forming)/AMP-acid ligase II